MGTREAKIEEAAEQVHAWLNGYVRSWLREQGGAEAFDDLSAALALAPDAPSVSERERALVLEAVKFMEETFDDDSGRAPRVGSEEWVKLLLADFHETHPAPSLSQAIAAEQDVDSLLMAVAVAVKSQAVAAVIADRELAVTKVAALDLRAIVERAKSGGGAR